MSENKKYGYLDGIKYEFQEYQAIVVEYDKESYRSIVSIPESLTFEGKSYSVRKIGNNAFRDAKHLTTIKIPSTVYEIDSRAFLFCCNLKEFIIPNSVKSIGSSAFDGCNSLTKIIIPNSVTTIGDYAFGECAKLNEILFGKGVKSIGESAFSGCSALTDITIPNNVTKIGSKAFQGCTSLNNVNIISGSDLIIWRGAFQQCKSLKGVNIQPNALSQSKIHIDTNVFSSCENLENVTFGDVITTIGKDAFYFCKALKSITIPKASDIYEEAFCFCESLETVNINGAKDGGRIFQDAFLYCTSLTNVFISNMEIGERAFHGCSGLRSIYIPSSVKRIGKRAFLGCSGITSVTIQDTQTCIGKDAFSQCPGLVKESPSKNSNSKSSDIDTGKELYINKKDGLVYAENVLVGYCSKSNYENELKIKKGTIKISDNALAGNEEIHKVWIPDTVTSIGNGAFRVCPQLCTVILGNSIISIGEEAFAGCPKLKQINLPNTIKSIGKKAFVNTEWLNNHPYGLIYVGNMLYGYKNKDELRPYANIPSKKYLYKPMILETLIVQEGTQGIADSAFEGCEELTSIMIPASARCGIKSFHDCKNLSSLFISGRGETHSGPLNCNIKLFCIGSRVTAVKGIKVNPTENVCCYAKNPPECDENTFANYNVVLHIPPESLGAYFAAPYWNKFPQFIQDAIEPSCLSLNRNIIELEVNETFKLDAFISPKNAYPTSIVWTSDNSAVAQVSEFGVIKAKNIGTCNIKAHSYYKSAVCHVTVNEITMHISLDLKEAKVQVNRMISLGINASPITPSGYTAKSSNLSVAVTRIFNGMVQIVGVGVGTAIITVDSIDGKSRPATCKITVF